MRWFLFLALSIASFSGLGSSADAQDRADLVGRWDVTVTDGSMTYPSWFEVTPSGRSALVGRYVGQFGSARPISEVTYEDGHFRFEVPPQWEDRKTSVVYEGHWEGKKLVGVTTNDQGEQISWIANRAPELIDSDRYELQQPVQLFNGKNLDGWKTRSADQKNGWKVIDGILSNVEPGNDLITLDRFENFILKVQFRYPEGSNSGLYLRGRYEVQVEDNYGKPADSHHIGGVYGFLTPAFNACRKPGEWQDYTITLIGRRITVVLNDVRVIDQQLIPGITGGALDSQEGLPGPLMIQGDHGPVQYRQIQLTPILLTPDPIQ